VAQPGKPRLPGIHDHETDRHGHGNVDEADEEQLGPLTQRETGADERIQDRKEDEWDGEGLEQRDKQQAKPSQILVAQAAQIGFLTEDHSKQRATGHGDEHLCVERQRDQAWCGLHSGVVGAEEEYPFPCEKASQLEREGALPSGLYCEEEIPVQMIKSDGQLEGLIRLHQYREGAPE
jgi:hypothetical protein